MARQMGNLDEYDDITKEGEPIKLPPHAPEFAVKAQLVSNLFRLTHHKY